MSAHLDMMAHLLGEILDRPAGAPEDHRSLAATGERLRRMLAVVEDAEREGGGTSAAREALARYDAAHLELPSEDGIEQALCETLSECERLAREGEASHDAWEDALDGVDEVLSVAARAGRQRAMGPRAVERLGKVAQERLLKAAGHAPAAWRVAEDRFVTLRDDPDYEELFAFWEELAARGPVPCAIAEALSAPLLDREAVVAAFLDRVAPEARGEPSPLDRLVSWFAQQLDASRFVRVPAPLAAGYSDTAGAKLEVLWDDPGGAIVVACAESVLTIRCAAPLVIGEARAELEAGGGIPTRRIDEQCVELDLPGDRAGNTISIALVVDGRTLRLPPIRLVGGG